MKFIKKIFIIMPLMLLITSHLYAAIGCMADSYNLEKLNDHKTRHYVKCTCPCNQYKILGYDSKCLVCFHYHAPRKWMVVRGNEEIMTTEQYVGTGRTENETLTAASQKTLTHMIAQYKKERAYRERTMLSHKRPVIGIGKKD